MTRISLHQGITVDVTELMGNEVFMYMISGQNTFVGRLDPRTNLRTGQQANVVFNMDNMHIFETEGDQKRIH